jgi:GST-like protein
MLELYTFPSSNGQRAAIALEECGIPYRVRKVDLAKGEQRAPQFLAINPAGTIPALVDPDGPGGAPLNLAQSGAIVVHAAERSGRLLPGDARRRAEAWRWFFHAVTDCACASVGIYLASAQMPDKSDANARYFEERTLRFLRVVDGVLADRSSLAGEYSIADVALYPLAATRRPLIESAGDCGHLLRWLDEIGERPAVQRGMQSVN